MTKKEDNYFNKDFKNNGINRKITYIHLYIIHIKYYGDVHI